MSGIDRAILSAMAREQMEKDAALGIGKAYRGAVSSAAKYLAPKWNRVGEAGKWLGTAGGRIGPETGLLGQAAVHGGRVAAGAGIGAAAGALSSEDKKKGALTGAIAGGLGAGVLPYALKTLHQTGIGTAKMVSRPINTAQEAWRGMGHTFTAAQKAKMTPAQLAEATKAEAAIAEKATAQPGWWTKTKAWVKGKTPAEQQALQNQHLYQDGIVRAPEGFGAAWNSAQGLGKVKALAGEASRQGWTGKGGVTKYLPGGGKALTVGFGAASLPTMYRSATGDVPLSEGIGEIGSNLGYLAAGAVPGGTFFTPLLMGELASRGMKAPAQWLESRKKNLQVPDALRTLQAQGGRLRQLPQQVQQAVQQVPQAIANEVQR